MISTMLKQVVFFCIISLLLLCASLQKTYGPFKLTITNFEVCFGPKNKNCTALEANVTGDTTIFINLRVIKNCVPSKGKIVASSSGKDLVRLHMNKPCDHLFLKPLLMAMYNISEQCLFLKGDYSRKVDIGTIADKYFGGSFFYGNITFKANFYNDECNFSCTTIQVTLSPK